VFKTKLNSTNKRARKNFELKVESYSEMVKSSPVETWSAPEVSRKLSFPDFMTTAQDGGKVVSRTHPPPLPPGNTPATHFY
jgi:hypothetical protein